MNFINKHKLLIIITILLIGYLTMKDSSIIKLMVERDVEKLNDVVFTKVIYYSFIIGALVCKWCLVLDENFNFFKKKTT